MWEAKQDIPDPLGLVFITNGDLFSWFLQRKGWVWESGCTHSLPGSHANFTINSPHLPPRFLSQFP